MSKFFKIFLLTTIFILLTLQVCLATESSGDMLTQPMDQTEVSTESSIGEPATTTAPDNTPNTASNPISNETLDNMQNTSSDTNTLNNTENLTTDQENESTPTSTPLSSGSQVTGVSNISSLPEANLGLNNILSILLIAIGFLLILFAIAILIRLKK